MIDTGIDATHPDLPHKTKVLANWEVAAAAAAGVRACAFADLPNTDDDGHGIHVSGTIAGTGQASGGRFKGVAPDAKLIGYSTNVGVFILTASAVCSYSDIIADRAITGVRVVSNSWGGGIGGRYDPDHPISVAIEKAFEAGITSVFAAGNSGPEDNTMTSRFSVSPFVVGVGAITKPGQLVMFSSRGRPFDNQDRSLGIANNVGVYRPTVVAPGVRITAPITGGGYATLSGTSMATPHVSGVIALVLEANPALTPLQQIQVLEGTATPMPGYFAHEVGAGLVNAFAASQLALQIKQDPSTQIPAGKFNRSPPAVSRITTTNFPTQFIIGSSTTADPNRAEIVRDLKVTVEPGAVRLYVDIEWILDTHNFYLFLFKPGANLKTDFPAQEAVGLLDAPLTFRFVDARNPEPGDWTIRILARVNTADFVFTTALVSYAAATTPDGLGVSLSIKKSEKEVEPGGTVAYSLRLTNTGTRTTTYQLSISGVPAGWSARLKTVEVTLASGESTKVVLWVTAPTPPKKQTGLQSRSQPHPSPRRLENRQYPRASQRTQQLSKASSHFFPMEKQSRGFSVAAYPQLHCTTGDEVA